MKSSSSQVSNISPRQLFLIDGIGALLSSIMLGIVLVHWQEIIGMPTNVLYFLAGIAVLFILHSLYRYIKFVPHWNFFLQHTAFANLIYCFATLSLLLYFWSEMTSLGIVYFVLEMILIVSLSSLELKSAK